MNQVNKCLQRFYFDGQPVCSGDCKIVQLMNKLNNIVIEVIDVG